MAKPTAYSLQPPTVVARGRRENPWCEFRGGAREQALAPSKEAYGFVVPGRALGRGSYRQDASSRGGGEASLIPPQIGFGQQTIIFTLGLACPVVVET